MNQILQNQAAAAQGTITLGNCVYLVSQPTPQDMQTIARYLRDLVTNPLKMMANDIACLPVEIRQQFVDAALRLQMRRQMPANETEWQQATTGALMTPEGVAFIAWVLIRKEQPHVTLELIKANVTDTNYMDVLTEITAASGMAQWGNLSGPTGAAEKSA